MKVAVVGGGPAGLYFALLLKKAVPDNDIVVYERNPPGATYGWGVVFSDRTLTSFREADYKTFTQITDNFIIWDAIDVSFKDQIVRCGGQVFSGISRKVLLGLLHARCEELGVPTEHEHSITDIAELNDHDLIVAADGIRSTIRAAHEDVFRPRFSQGRTRYIWFGTHRAFDSFTFAFRPNNDGFFQAHAYPFDGRTSTFIVECNEPTWRKAGLDQASEQESIDYCQKLFAPELRGHELMSNNSRWINFETLKSRTWYHRNVVLLGDAAHTAHFSIGSGTKLAMEDAIALANALQTKPDISSALAEYQMERKPRVERFQEAARQSQTYFESTRRYQHMEPFQFAFHLLSRSGRIDYTDLRMRDPHFVASVDRHFTDSAPSNAIAQPPSFAPLKLRDLTIPNRVAIAPPPAYGSKDGVPLAGELAEVARTGAGLVFTGTVAISDHARITPGCPGIYRPERTAAWKEEIDRARSNSDAALAITLGHAGSRGATRARSRTTDVPLPSEEAWPLLAASPLPYTSGSQAPHEMTRAKMDDVRNDFVAATVQARDAGFDMLELHMGYGYLLAGFISPLTNQRTDNYGGNNEGRLRYPLEVLAAVRAEWPDDRLLGIAFCASDWARGGLTLRDAVAAAQAFNEHGCDMLRVLAGQTVSGYKPRYDPYYLAHYSDRLRNEARIPTIATGPITTVDHVNTLVAAGRADLCLLRSTY